MFKKKFKKETNEIPNTIMVRIPTDITDGTTAMPQCKNENKSIDEAFIPPMPAVTFDYNVYGIGDYLVPIDGSIYSKLIDSNAEIVNQCVECLDNNNIASSRNLIHKVERSTIDIIISKFLTTLDSCMRMHLYNMDSIISVVFEKNTNYTTHLFGPNPETPSHELNTIFNTSINRFELENIVYCIGNTGSLSEQVKMFNNGYVYNSIISFINSFGASIYNYIRLKLNTILSCTYLDDSNKNIVQTAISNIDREFCRMMTDFCYESSIFCDELFHFVANIAIPTEVIGELKDPYTYDYE